MAKQFLVTVSEDSVIQNPFDHLRAMVWPWKVESLGETSPSMIPVAEKRHEVFDVDLSGASAELKKMSDEKVSHGKIRCICTAEESRLDCLAFYELWHV